MPLEAVMICIDNSDYTRNGDYMPTRFESQADAVNLVCGAKTNQNPENSVGLLTSAGDRVEVMITPTSDLGRMITELAKIKVGGSADILRAIQTAQLALKHRQNKNQKQRIIAFVGSPIGASEKELETLGKNLKKNNVSLDIVSFGEVEENAPKLEKLLAAVNSNDTSHILEVPVGPKLLSDVLLSSAIVNPDGEAGVGGGGGGEQGFEFGINPNDDPELALALRISMEEERARQQQRQAAEGGAPAEGAAAAAGGAPAAEAQPAPATGAPPADPVAADSVIMDAMGMDDMDEELRQALALSLQEAGGPPPPAAPPQAPAAPPATEAPAAPAGGDKEWLQDPNFVQELLGSLPGVDINDPRIQSVLKDTQAGSDKDKEGGGGGSGSGDKGPQGEGK